ncbi:hypothetical protein [Spirochaeta dissipatitropha]
MQQTQKVTEHDFHIPVLGTGYSIDTALKVARFGISSVLSLVDDTLIEQAREYHCRKNSIVYEAISSTAVDHRARRITAYLDLLHDLVQKQIVEMQKMEFNTGSDLDTCFEMLPDGELRTAYFRLLDMEDGSERTALAEFLKKSIQPGSIDVNIMTKLDRQRWVNGEPVDSNYSDASAALRGFAESKLNAGIVFSAGMNPRLFAAIEQYPDFFADNNGYIKKKIILKVSDYRSANIQGTILAKKGIWISEYRIESGLNCGGHAFAAKGSLMGPILAEFREKKEELFNKLHAVYCDKCAESGRNPGNIDIRITVQGGIGTSDENKMLLKYFQVSSVGWGTPFLLVPEAVNLDESDMKLLCDAEKKDVFLSQASPLGVPFWNLHTSESENARKKRITSGKPGVACRKKYLAFNDEYTEEPICPASSKFQRHKLEDLAHSDLPVAVLDRLRERVLAKACLCMDLGATFTRGIGIEPKGTPAITPGPNIINFNRIVGLKEMVAHIYGRLNIISVKNRSHAFIRELEIYIDTIGQEFKDAALGIGEKSEKYFGEVRKNLLAGIEYYRELADEILQKEKTDFLKQLDSLRNYLVGTLPENL